MMIKARIEIIVTLLFCDERKSNLTNLQSEQPPPGLKRTKDLQPQPRRGCAQAPT
jgi:hypothetical protein